MKIIFNKCIAIVICHLIPLISYGQTISLGFGPIFTQSVQKVKLINGVNDFQNTGFNLIIEYENKLKLNNSELFASLNLFPGETWIRIMKNKVTNAEAVGHRGINVKRLDLGFSYIRSIGKYFYIKPSVGIGLQYSKPNGLEFFDTINGILGTDYTETKPIEVESLNTFQFTPCISIKTGVIILKRIDIHVIIKGTFGFKSYQTMYFNYLYKGIPQEPAIIEARGTGLFPSFGIGYKIAK